MNLFPHDLTTPSLRLTLLARIMQVANARPEFMSDQWYSLKTRLIKRFGSPDGYDTQRLEASCHECAGTGKDLLGHTCRRCDNGVHHITRTLLSRWKIQDTVFHQIEKSKLTEAELANIRSHHPALHHHFTARIIHPPGFGAKASREALLWLTLSFDGVRALVRLLSRGAYCYPGIYPLLHLQRLVFDLHISLIQFRRRTRAAAMQTWSPANEEIPF